MALAARPKRTIKLEPQKFIQIAIASTLHIASRFLDFIIY